MKLIYLLLLLWSGSLLAQERTIAQFVIWKPKEGLEQTFATGYKKHLQWHRSNNDTWGWYGWYFISGPRSGQFMDATIDHSWNDFDSPVSPAADVADGELHVYHFADFQGIIKAQKIIAASAMDTAGLKSKFVRLITLTVTDMTTALKIIEGVKARYAARGMARNFVTYKPVDGGVINQVMIMLGFPDYTELGKTDNIQDELFNAETALKIKVITSITSELLLYRSDMSSF